MTATLSIISPSLNQAAFIERAIASVAQQSVPATEHIIMDGGSHDETLQTLKKFSHRLSYHSEADKGQSHALNKALQRTQGDIIGWLNVDDIYLPNTFRKVMAFFHNNPAIDILYGKALHIDAQDNIINNYRTRSWDYNALLKRCYLCQPAVFFRRRIVEKFGDLNETLHFCMDYEYWLRTAKGGAEFYYLQDYLAASRLHSQCKTKKNAVIAKQEVIAMLRHYTHKTPLRWYLSLTYSRLKKGNVHVQIEKNHSLAKNINPPKPRATND